MLSEKQFEDILCRYPELIEDGLTHCRRQVTVYNRRMDILFEDRFGSTLIVELKRGAIKDTHVGQIMAYEGLILSADDPTIRVMLIGTRVPPNIRKSLDHHGIAWREISYTRLKDYVQSKNDMEFIRYFEDENLQADPKPGVTHTRKKRCYHPNDQLPPGPGRIVRFDPREYRPTVISPRYGGVPMREVRVLVPGAERSRAGHSGIRARGST